MFLVEKLKKLKELYEIMHLVSRICLTSPKSLGTCWVLRRVFYQFLYKYLGVIGFYDNDGVDDLLVDYGARAKVQLHCIW